jgi:hypothetical protein
MKRKWWKISALKEKATIKIHLLDRKTTAPRSAAAARN